MVNNNLLGKRVLVICKESYSFPLFYLTQKLIEGSEVASFFINPMETFLNKSLMNENTYYKFRSLDKVRIYDLNDEAHYFTNNLDTPRVDWTYISLIQSKYTFYKTISFQLATAQMFSYDSHFRTYYSSSTREQRMFWLQLNYQKVEKILQEFKPDVIIDLDNSEMQRSIIAEVSRFFEIPYISIGYPRVENYKIPSYACVWENSIFLKKYAINHNSSIDIDDEIKYVQNFRSKKKIMSSEFNNQVTSQFARTAIIKVIKNIYSKIYYLFSLDFISKNFFIRRKNSILFHSSFKYFKFILFTEIKRWYLFGKNRYFHDPINGEKYVLMPLHLVPESSTFVLAPFFVDELHCIKQVAKSLPANLVLYVKEHQVMVGERGLEFYKVVNSLPNVRMVQFNYFDDPKPWITNSEGVITITGTGAYEAALLGKKSIVFGDVPFGVIDSITKISSFDELPKVLSTFGNSDIDNLKSCAVYIKTVKELGFTIPIHYLMSEAERLLINDLSPSQDFLNSIDILYNFFDSAYSNVCQN
jgi:hypothetical protein